MDLGHDLSQIHAGLRTPVFKVKLKAESVRLFHDSVRWAGQSRIAPTLPVTFWQKAYPEWLLACTLPQILREQSVTYYEPLQLDQEYDCWIECTHLSYQETKSGKTFLSATHRLSGNREGKRVWDADTVLYIPSPVPDGVVAKTVMPTVQTQKLPTNQEPVWEEMVTVDQIRQFAFASGDRQAIHLDKQVAEAAGYPHVLAHGMYSVGLPLSHYLQHVANNETLLQLRIQFVGPLFAGDTLCYASTSTTGYHQLIGFEKGKGKLVFVAELQGARKE